MIKYLRLMALWSPLLLLPLFWSNHNLLLFAVLTQTLLVIGRYVIILIMGFFSKCISIGLLRFYLPALSIQLVASLLMFLFWKYEIHELTQHEIHHSTWTILYFLLILGLERKKNIFIVTNQYLLHIYKLHTTYWKMPSIRKVKVYSHKVEFIRGNTKLKAIFSDDLKHVHKIVHFLQPILQNKLSFETE